MEKLAKNQLENVLVDVRKAYRLLYFFQRRVMDTADFCARQLERTIQYGYSLYSSNAPKNGSRLDIDRWAWDWLNMYSYEFHLGEEVIGGDIYNSAITIHADSGLDDSPEGVKELDVEKFVPAELCVTKIYFYVGKNMWKPPAFQNEWSRDSKDEYVYKEEENKLFISKRFDLSDLFDESSITSCVDAFKVYCKNNNVLIFT